MMDIEFNPSLLREDWARHWLSHVRKERHGEIAETAKARYAHIVVEMYVEAYLIGLGAEVAPLVGRFLSWMDRESEPDREAYISGDANESGWWIGLWQWRLSKGIAQWLDGAPCSESLAAAAAANCEGLERARYQKEFAEVKIRRQHDVAMHLLSLLIADTPAIGLRFLALSEMSAESQREPIVAFAKWAFGHLVEGHGRDQAFLRHAEKLLGQGLMANLLTTPAYLLSVLCLKAIYFDSGCTQTAQETIMKAYDWLPGVARPGSSTL